MRIPSLRLFVPLFLAVSPMAVPASAHAAPTTASPRDGVSVTGLYRITMTARNRKPKTVHLVVRNGENGLSAILMDKQSEAVVTELRMEGTVLKGSIMTSEGPGDLELQLGSTSVRGTLMVDGKLLMIDGDRDN